MRLSYRAKRRRRRPIRLEPMALLKWFLILLCCFLFSMAFVAVVGPMLTPD
jgi:hypothetical protein